MPCGRELLDLAFSFKGSDAVHVSIAKAEIFKNTKDAGVEAFMTRKDYKKLK